MASTLKIILAVGGIFVAGAVTGGFVGARVFGHLSQKKPVVERIGSNEIGARLAEQLQLTPEQKEKIQPLLGRTSEELRKVRREAFSQTAALVSKMDAELAKELTEEQRVLLKDVRAKEEERRKKWMADRAERAKRNEGQRGSEGAGVGAPGGPAGPGGPERNGPRPPPPGLPPPPPQEP